MIFYDIDEKKVQNLRNSGLDATTELSNAIRESDISFLCLPTPTKDRKIDLSYIRFATENLARLQGGASTRLVKIYGFKIKK